MRNGFVQKMFLDVPRLQPIYRIPHIDEERFVVRQTLAVVVVVRIAVDPLAKDRLGVGLVVETRSGGPATPLPHPILARLSEAASEGSAPSPAHVKICDVPRWPFRFSTAGATDTVCWRQVPPGKLLNQAVYALLVQVANHGAPVRLHPPWAAGGERYVLVLHVAVVELGKAAGGHGNPIEHAVPGIGPAGGMLKTGGGGGCLLLPRGLPIQNAGPPAPARAGWIPPDYTGGSNWEGRHRRRAALKHEQGRGQGCCRSD